ncbi:hypothetical protein CH275_25705 [Rhodococcus sp. 06-235-1A]|nr:hypothetical protein CH275_25705 [Rhodococcus sp. 06-235-1A]
MASFDYSLNEERYKAMGTIYHTNAHSYRIFLRELVAGRLAARRDANSEQSQTLRFAIDISSMDRDRLAGTVLALMVDQVEEIEIDFYYSCADFDEKLVGSEGPIHVNRPISGFEGWTSTPDLPLACVLGLGFEHNLALGALETLEPTDAYLFVASGVDDRYDHIVMDRNSALIEGVTENIYQYSVRSPMRTALAVESIVHSLVRSRRVILVPIGTKIFALACFLVGVAYGDELAVWRLSADSARTPENRVCTTDPVGVSVLLRKKKSLT